MSEGFPAYLRTQPKFRFTTYVPESLSNPETVFTSNRKVKSTTSKSPSRERKPSRYALRSPSFYENITDEDRDKYLDFDDEVNDANNEV